MQHTTIYTILSIFFYNTTHTTIHYNAMPYHAIKKLHNTVQNTFYSTRPLYKTTQCNMFYNTHYNTYYVQYKHDRTPHNPTQHTTRQYNTTIQYKLIPRRILQCMLWDALHCVKKIRTPIRTTIHTTIDTCTMKHTTVTVHATTQH